jgi:hypothetical protein
MKKILALVLALAMALGTFSIAAAAPEDVVGTDYEEAVVRLVALGIIDGFEDGTYRPDEPVTRAQFAKIVVASLGVGEAAQYAKGATKFSDVPADHWATGYINVAVDVGVIAGYPDGTFQPENQVTFAEAIKMIVAALGYTPKAEAMGGYPGGYLAVAAEEEITDGVNVVGNLAADRGAVAIMIDNSLDVYLMEQKSYGDNPTWEASETKTLLNTKLGVKEVEGVVTGISKTEKLDENEFILDGEDKYEMAIDANTESLFLKEVKILHKNDKVVWVNVETSASDIVLDTVVDVDAEEIELKAADKTYDVVEDAKIYVNFEEVGALAGDYGYFIFDGKEIVAANLFNFEDKGLVTAVAEDEIEYIDLFDAEEQVLELDDYDEIYVYNKDFTKASLEDIDENSLMFFWDNDDDELFVMVVNEAVEGEVTRLRTDRVTIDGKNYVRAADESIVSLNEGKDFDTWGDASTYDIMNEDVVLYLDLNGEIAAMVTSAKVTSDTLYGIVTWFYSGRNARVAVFTSEGEEVEYYFEDSVDVEKVDSYPNDNETVMGIKYELNSDGEIAEGTLEFEDVTAIVTKAADRKYVVDDGDTYFVNSDTVLMKALDDEGELDPELVKYESLVSMSFTSNGNAVIFGEEGKTAKMIVFTNKDFEGSKDDVYFGVVTDAPWKVGTSWFAEMDIFGAGKADYKVSAGDVAKGNLVAFYLDSSDKVDLTEEANVVEMITGTVYSRDGSYITLDSADGDVYRIASGAVLYQLDDDYKLDGTIRLTRINKDDTIALMYDTVEKEVVAAIVNAELDK